MKFINGSSEKYAIALYLVICGFIVLHMNSLQTENPVRSDAAQNLNMAYSLYNYGTLGFTSGGTDLVTPTNYREPFPPFISALFMYLHPDIKKGDSIESFIEGVNTTNIKQVNLLWITVLLLGVGLLVYYTTNSVINPLIALLFVIFYFVRFGGHFDNLYTELPAATLIIWSSLLFVLTIKKNKPVLFFTSGIMIGLLILTKSVFFYLFPIMVLFLIIFSNHRNKLLRISLFIVGTCILVAPWLLRNYSIYQEVSVTQRGGGVLHTRAIKNQMTSEEIYGAIYFWGPGLYQRLVRNTSLDARDEDFESQGRYVRLNRGLDKDSLAVEIGSPRLAESFFQKSRAETNRLQSIFRYQGKEDTRKKAYEVMEADAKKMILDQPVEHIFMSFLFLWRGIWCFPNSTIPLLGDQLQIYINNSVNLLSYLSMMLLFIFGVIKRKPVIIALTIIPVSMLMFQGFITHNIPRFSEPTIPSMLVCLTLVAHYCRKKIIK